MVKPSWSSWTLKTYEEQQETLALLKLLALGNKEIEAYPRCKRSFRRSGR